MSPCDKLFNIPELCEAVFLQLSMRDLLCGVQQTCRQWKAIVDSSTPLQRELFLKPIRYPPLRWSNREERWRTSQDDPKSHKVYEHPLFSSLDDDRYTSRGIEPEALLRREASWRKCLVTQPPVVELVLRPRLPNGDMSAKQATVVNKGGIRLQQLFADPTILPTGDMPFWYINGWKGWKWSALYEP